MSGKMHRVMFLLLFLSAISSHAAAIAWQLGRKVTFDPATEAFIRDDEANRMRTRAKRAPWHA